MVPVVTPWRVLHSMMTSLCDDSIADYDKYISSFSLGVYSANRCADSDQRGLAHFYEDSHILLTLETSGTGNSHKMFDWINWSLEAPVWIMPTNSVPKQMDSSTWCMRVGL